MLQRYPLADLHRVRTRDVEVVSRALNDALAELAHREQRLERAQARARATRARWLNRIMTGSASVVRARWLVRENRALDRLARLRDAALADVHTLNAEYITWLDMVDTVRAAMVCARAALTAVERHRVRWWWRRRNEYREAGDFERATCHLWRPIV